MGTTAGPNARVMRLQQRLADKGQKLQDMRAAHREEVAHYRAELKAMRQTLRQAERAERKALRLAQRAVDELE